MKGSKTKMSRILGLLFYAKITFLDGKVVDKHSHSKKAICLFINREIRSKFKSIYIKVIYKKGIYNDGKYLAKDIDEMWKAWRAFIEEDLIRDAINNY